MFLNNNNITAIITEQPSQKVHFRYATENRRPEPIYGISNTKSNKSHTAIQILGYEGKLFVDVIPVCAALEGRPILHPHRLINHHLCKHGCYRVELDITQDDPFFELKGVGVEHCVRDDFDTSINEKAAQYPNFNRPASFDSVNKSQILLCFLLTIFRDNQPITLSPVYSDVINDKRIYSKLTIERLSKAHCTVNGGEEIFILCSKIKKDDINVVLKDPITGIEGFGILDVFKEVAIVFKVPAYHDLTIRNEHQVLIFLRQPSLAQDGEPKIFTYLPINDDPYGIKDKKRKLEVRNGSDNVYYFDQSNKSAQIGHQAVSSNIYNPPSYTNTDTISGSRASNQFSKSISSSNVNPYSNVSNTNVLNTNISNNNIYRMADPSMLPQSVVSLQEDYSQNTLIPRFDLSNFLESQPMSTASKLHAQSANRYNKKQMPVSQNLVINEISPYLPNSVTDFNWDENSITNIKYGSAIFEANNTPIPIFTPDIQKLSLESDFIDDEYSAAYGSSKFAFANEPQIAYANEPQIASSCAPVQDSINRFKNQRQSGDLFETCISTQLDMENILVGIKEEDIDYLNEIGVDSLHFNQSNSQNLNHFGFTSSGPDKYKDNNFYQSKNNNIPGFYSNINENLTLFNAGDINTSMNHLYTSRLNNNETNLRTNLNLGNFGNIDECNPAIALNSNCNLNQLNFGDIFCNIPSDEVTDNLDSVIFENMADGNISFNRVIDIDQIATDGDILNSEEMLEFLTELEFDNELFK